MNKSYFCRNFFLTDWRHKRFKNTIDPLLFYGEHFYGFSESDIIDAVVLALLISYERVLYNIVETQWDATPVISITLSKSL